MHRLIGLLVLARAGMLSVSIEDAMPQDENLTVTLPVELAVEIKTAVEAGDYGSPSELVGVALRAWSARRSDDALLSLKTDIEVGLADIAAGRIREFDQTRVLARGRDLLRSRSSSD